MGCGRPLRAEEIAILERQGCRAEDWQRIEVAEDFDPHRLYHVVFSGQVFLGGWDPEESLSLPKKGMESAWLHNVSIGRNVHIRHVRDRIADCEIEEDVTIEDVGAILCTGETTFGNGVVVHAMTESGARSIPIFDRLSAMLAYILVVYRHRPLLLEQFKAMITDRISHLSRSRCWIGRGAVIRGVGSLVDVHIGPSARIEGALKLRNVTVGSEAEDPSCVGSGVILEDAVFAVGSAVADGAILRHVFVGQGTRIGRQFAAEHSLFFANCEMDLGEASSFFAGPFTVSHHKGTLLLTALSSFFNAGSGTNASNHLYKLGPLHQGVLERGCKTGSGSYLLWPSRIGAFTTILGKQDRHLDTSDYPFSLLREGGLCIPGALLFSVGLWRDQRKWLQRDRRRTADRLDFFHPSIFNPYTASKMLRACDRLQRLAERPPSDLTEIEEKGVRIPRSRLARAVSDYTLALRLYLAESLVRGMEKRIAEGADPFAFFSGPKRGGEGESEEVSPWVDLAGLLAPRWEVERILQAIEEGSIDSLSCVEAKFRELYTRYEEWEWAWCWETFFRERQGRKGEVTPDEVRALVQQWKVDANERTKRLLADAEKEFTSAMRTSYGLDGGAEEIERDFLETRGRFEDHPIVREIREEEATIQARIDRLLRSLA